MLIFDEVPTSYNIVLVCGNHYSETDPMFLMLNYMQQKYYMKVDSSHISQFPMLIIKGENYGCGEEALRKLSNYLNFTQFMLKTLNEDYELVMVY